MSDEEALAAYEAADDDGESWAGVVAADAARRPTLGRESG